MRLRFCVAVAVAVVSAGSHRTDWTPSLGTSICRRCGPKRPKKKKREKKIMHELEELMDIVPELQVYFQTFRV